MAISSMSELRDAYRPPAARAHQKVLDRLDGHARRFIELSPLCIISSIGADAVEIDASEDEANRERLY